MPITLQQYYKAFISLYGLLSALPLVSEVGSVFVLKGLLYPPLGNVQLIAMGTTGIFVLVATLIVFFCFRHATTRYQARVIGLCVATVLLVGAYIALHVRFVKTREIPSRNTEVSVSVGYERSFEGRDKPENDLQLLDAQGSGEDQIERFWTNTSIVIVRLSLWLSFTLAAFCFTSIFSIGAMQHALEKAATHHPGSK